MNRSAGISLLGFGLLMVARPAAAQMDEKPPVLRRSDSPNARGQSTSTPGTDRKATLTVRGVVRQIDAQSLTVEAEDTRILNCKITSATAFAGPDGKVSAEDVMPGARVRLTAKPGGDEAMIATLVLLESAPSKEPNTGEDSSVFSKPPDDDANRPVLRRGVPSKSKKAASADTSAGTKDADTKEDASADSKSEGVGLGGFARRPDPSGTSASASSGSVTKNPDLIERAREADDVFTEKLPNFVCQQYTTRYQRESKAAGWQARDIVTATVVYMDGKENYQDIKVGNRAVQKDMMAIEGQRSVGEFGSTVRSLLSRRTDAEFHFVHDADVKRLRAKVYDFKVPRDRSDWRIMVEGQTVIPGYSGRVWIDRDSARVLRLERQADAIPEAFPMDVIEQTVDYDFILIGGEKTLLPAESENLSCQRGTPYCGKNVLEFRAYKQFKGDATILFDK